jgi:hypothetical protein
MHPSRQSDLSLARNAFVSMNERQFAREQRNHIILKISTLGDAIKRPKWLNENMKR